MAATRHLLPCTCGRSVEVDVGQAGQQVFCQCGRSLDVPTMRALRALPAVPVAALGVDGEPAGQEPPPWSPRQGGLFSSGVLISVIALGLLAYFGWARLQIDTTPPPPDDPQMVEAIFDRPIDRLYEEYLEVREQGLDMLPPAEIVGRRRVANFLDNALIATSVALVIGLGLTGSAFVIRPG